MNSKIDKPINKWEEMFSKVNIEKIQDLLDNELRILGDQYAIYPPKNLVFNAFELP